MFLSDTSALFATLATDDAWSALPDAPIVDDGLATTSWRTVARRVVRQVLPQREQTSDPCATPVLR